MTALFISHSSSDEAASREMLARLKQAGFVALFLDFDPGAGIPAGREWEAELYAQLRKADGIVFIATRASVASLWCHSELVLARSLNKPIFPVVVEPTERHPLLDDVQWIDATIDLQDGLRRLVEGLLDAGLDPADSFAWDATRSPYPGLAPFDADHAAVFFGRDREIARLLELLSPPMQRRGGRFVVVVGPSGSGKSSLVRAGLVPRLSRIGHRWLILPTIVPGDRPMANLARSLAAGGGAASRSRVQRQLEEVGSEGLVDELRDLCEQTDPMAEHVLVVVDQAEELIARSSEVERRRFLVLLAEALHPDSPLWVVATVRSEFLGRLVNEAAFADIIDEPFVLGPVSRSRLPEVIVRPARRAGLEYEPSLVERMVDDTVGGDALPLLAYTLQRLAERAGASHLITSGDYEAIGTVVGALTHQAERVVANLAARGLGDAVLPTLLRLASIEDGVPIRRRVPRSSFIDDGGTVIDYFVDARLLTARAVNGETTIAVAHEALLRQWPPLRGRIEAFRQEIELRADIERLAHDWDTAHRDESYLLRGVRLAQVDEIEHDAPLELERVEREYVAASRALAARETEQARAVNRRLRRQLIGLTTVLIIGVIAAAIAIERAAATQRQRTIARSGQLAAQATSLFNEDPYAGLLVSLEATRIAPTREAFQAVATGLSLPLAPSIGEPLAGHDGSVSSVAINGDGSLLASAGEDGTVRLWNPVTGEPVRDPLTGHDGRVWSVAFAGDGSLLASAGEDGTVRLWDPETSQPIGVPLAGHRGFASSVTLNRDGSLLASAGNDRTVRLWDPETGQPVGDPLTGHKFGVWAVAFNGDGSLLASAGEDGTVRLWDPETGQPVGDPLTGHDDWVLSVAFSGDGLLASASVDGTVRLWDPETGERVRQPLTGHDDDVSSVAFNDDGLLASASVDGTVWLWDPETGERVRQPLTGHDDDVLSVAFAGDGSLLASASVDGAVRLWDPENREALGETLHGHEVGLWSVAFSGNSGLLASADFRGTVRLWDPETGQPVGDPLTGHDGLVWSVALNGDGSLLASAGEDGTVRLWDPETGQPVGDPLTGHDGQVVSVAFNGDGSLLASAGVGGAVRLWDPETGQPVGDPLSGHDGDVLSVAFNDDGQLASAGDDGTVRLWDPETGQPVGDPLTGHDDWVWSVAFNDDGLLASAGEDGTVRLWDPETGQPVREPLTGHDDRVWTVAFSGDGGLLASAGEDGTVRLWDSETGRPVGAPLTGHDGRVSSVAFAGDGSVLASAGFDGTVRLWAALERWATLVCDIAGRNLSQDEWDRWVGADEPYVLLCPDLPPGSDAPSDAPPAAYPDALLPATE